MAASSNLKSLKIYGHRKNLGDLGALSTLEEFVFNPAKAMPLEFINGMKGLTALKLVLGGSEHLRDVHLPNLRDLAVTQTRGMSDLGDLQRFATLRRLLIQDEPHLKTILTGPGNSNLQHIWIHNCPGLGTIRGLADLPAILSLHASKTGLPENVIHAMPRTATHVLLGAGGPPDQKPTGLEWGDHPDMPFFYK